MSLRVYNTLSRQLEDFVPAEPDHVRMYVCGMTVYAPCHIGHARAMICFDVVYRWLRESGYRVTYARNHTDVDDKIIARANELGEAPLDLAARFIARLDRDLAALGLAEPTVAPKVSDHIDDIVTMTARLIEKGHAYASASGDVWFAVESFSDYGKLSGRKLEDLRAGERVAVNTDKRHPGDFALWKSAKSGEVAWDSPWGPGRPGWHIECSAMSSEHLGTTFDIHGGGIDLVFPHHENEIAQSECATGHSPYASVWMHNGHLTLLDDETGDPIKMSKSLGNVINISDLVEEVPREAIRILYMESHYRRPLPFSRGRLGDCLQAAERVYLARQVLEAMAERPVAATPEELARDLGEDAVALVEAVRGFKEAFSAAMNDDFNTSRALAELFELVRATNRYANHKKWWKRSSSLAQEALECFALAGRVLGVGDRTSAAFFEDLTTKLLLRAQLTREDVDAKVNARNAARAAKDWSAADSLRDELDGLGVVIMDGSEGTTWRMKVGD